MTLDRVVEILEAEKLEYVREDNDLLRTGFPNAAIGVVIEGDHLLFDAAWRGAPPSADAPKVLGAMNEWNLTRVMPSVSFNEISEGTLNIRAHRALYVGHGATHNQIGAFIMSAIQTTLACFEWLETEFPQYVTWKEAQ